MTPILNESYPTDEYSRIEGGAIAGRYLAQFWQPLALSREYKPGQVKRVKMLGNFYTLYRTADGEMKLVQDRCPHRGTSLAYGWVEGSSIRCRYHGWKFDATGQGEEFPAETATYARSMCIKTYPVREYLGVVFGFLGEGEAVEFPRFPELEDEASGELLSLASVLPYNYFQRVENDVDEVHVHFAHGEFAGTFGLNELPRITAKETEYGLVSTAARDDGSKHYTHCIMPNVMLREVVQQHDRDNFTMHAAWRVPIDDVSTYSLFIDRVKKPDPGMREKLAKMEDPNVIAAKVMRCEMTLDEIDQDHPLLPVIQDTVVMAGQGINTNREAEHLGASDRAIGLLRKLWQRELAALKEGRSLTSWNRSAVEKLKTIELGVAAE